MSELDASESPGQPTGLGVRLQKVLAQAGLGSRRQCEELIVAGRVQVDGEIVRQLGTRVRPESQQIRVDGQPIRPERFEYFALNKPPGVLSTNRDPSGRPRAIDLVKSSQRMYTVGRLDKSSEGLILVTNDGELANRLTHPRFGVSKTYLVTVVGVPSVAELQQLREGVYLFEGLAKVSSVKLKRRQHHTSELVIVLEEGRNRLVRRLLAKLGHKVLTLRRIAIGPLKLGMLPVGAHRRLEPAEVEMLKSATASPQRRGGQRRRRTGPRDAARPGARHRQSIERRHPKPPAGDATSRRRGGASGRASAEPGRRTNRRGAGRLAGGSSRGSFAARPSRGKKPHRRRGH
jgi:23S rRNA pseudouridine2605 synthase